MMKDVYVKLNPVFPRKSSNQQQEEEK